MAEIPTSSIAGSRVLESMFGGAAGKRPKNNTKTPKNQGIAESIYWPVILPALMLVAFGLLVVWSASLTISDASFIRQLIGVAFGVIAAIAVWRFDYRSLSNLTRILLIVDIVLMVLPLIPGLGYESHGMSGWIRIPFIGLTLQPSELAKLVTIYLMAALVAQYNGRIDNIQEYLKLCLTLAVPFVLILIQPDLGTGLIILFTGAMIIIAGGAKRSWVLSTLAIMIGIIALVIISSMTEGLPHILKDYQLKRLIVFVDPSVDPTGDGYNLQQAKIAVGSGGLFGKGIGNASQAGQGFLPEAHTDFVFALLAEEFGFVGSCVLIGLFGWLMVSCIRLSQLCEQPFAKLVVVGVVSMWCFQVLQNVGMCIGLMPITGIPLPFVSFGSSSMLTQLMAVGMIQSVWRYRQSPA
ncbi:MAG: rod shape-determining protein RodA [Atopobiaceae bacterium]|nr:rod shape-determining protein RodA [Atopobiaceae bacterium]